MNRLREDLVQGNSIVKTASTKSPYLVAQMRGLEQKKIMMAR